MLTRRTPHCAEAERKYSALQQQIAELQQQIAVLRAQLSAVDEQERITDDSLYYNLQLGRRRRAITAQLEPLLDAAAELHDAAQQTHLADLPADLYCMIFRFKHRAVCRRLHRWAKLHYGAVLSNVEALPRSIIYKPVYNDVSTTSNSYSPNAVKHVHAFLAKHPRVILCSDSCIQSIVKRLHHPRQVYFYHWGVHVEHADSITHLSCTSEALVINLVRCKNIQYIHVQNKWIGYATTVISQRPLRMTQCTYNRCSGVTFEPGVQIVQHCEMGLEPQGNLQHLTRGDSAFCK